MLYNSCSEQLEEIIPLLQQLSPEAYSLISPIFRTASIGQHIRHILELFDCLIEQYEYSTINYDLRKRDLKIEADPILAVQKIMLIQANINLPDKDLVLFQDQISETKGIKTSYFRELLYNLEHCVHHQALIRLACLPIPGIIIPENFGVAKSTITYKTGIVSKN